MTLKSPPARQANVSKLAAPKRRKTRQTPSDACSVALLNERAQGRFNDLISEPAEVGLCLKHFGVWQWPMKKVAFVVPLELLAGLAINPL